MTVGFSKSLPERLDIGGDVHRLDVGQLADAWCWSHQAKNRPAGPVVGRAGVLVADGGGEEFEEAARGLVAGGGDYYGNDNSTRNGRCMPRSHFRERRAHFVSRSRSFATTADTSFS